MARITIWLGLLGLCAATPTEQTPRVVRAISDDPAVLAVYVDSIREPSIISVMWADGYAVWSEDRHNGGAPYREGRIEAKKVTDLLKRFERDGLFADEKLNQLHFGPDSSFTTVLIKSLKGKVEMSSWHELYEANGKVVATDHGLSSLDDRRRLDVLRKEPGDYLFFRFVWSETRNTLNDMLPTESTPSTGKPIRNAGKLSWQGSR